MELKSEPQVPGPYTTDATCDLTIDMGSFKEFRFPDKIWSFGERGEPIWFFYDVYVLITKVGNDPAHLQVSVNGHGASNGRFAQGSTTQHIVRIKAHHGGESTFEFPLDQFQMKCKGIGLLSMTEFFHLSDPDFYPGIAKVQFLMNGNSFSC